MVGADFVWFKVGSVGVPLWTPSLSICVNCSCKEGGTLKCGEQLDKVETARDMEWAGWIVAIWPKVAASCV